MIDGLIKGINTIDRIYIVGAHSRARTVAAYLCYLYPSILIEAYLIDNEEENAETIDGIPVIKFNKDTKLHKDYPVFIGTRGMHHAALSERLREFGMEQVYPVTVELDLKLRNMYLKKYFSSVGRKFEKIDDFKISGGLIKKDRNKTKNCVYVTRSIYDQSLLRAYVLPDYEKPIQAGTALTDKRLSEGILTDNVGENISKKNRQYCELTVLYWIWKNAREDVVGLVHYRRHFLLPENWLERMTVNEIDVILPVPLYVAPNLAENFKSRHDPSDWNYMMQELGDEEYRDAERFFQGNLYSPCNMFIIKRSVLNDLCSWLFPILDAVVKHGGEKSDKYINRYPGFISERLITFFFEKHRREYKIVYADKNFLD